MSTDDWGIDDGWVGNNGTWHPAPDATLAAIRAAVGGEQDLPTGRPALIVRPGTPTRLREPSTVRLEDGTELGELGALPPDLPLGVHEARSSRGQRRIIIVSPGRCHLPRDLRTWGVAMQVPTTRAARGWGIGDLADVRAVARWLDGLGAGALALSPLHAPTPVSPIPPSPYYPSSRRWRSPLLVRVDEVPGAAEVREIDGLAAAAREAAEARPLVDRDVVWDRQRRALDLLWDRQRDRLTTPLGAWRVAQGSPLEGWALYCALADEHGPSWATWPRELRHPGHPAVAQAARSLADRVAFHAWLQLLVDDQLRRARVGTVRLIQDLAIGVDPGGADAWLDQDLLALDVSVGAPPDDFAPEGQSWGLPPFIPARLRAAGYRPWAQLLRSAMAHGGLRVDHVMGLRRLFWIPKGAPPTAGTYVRFPGRELLEVLALESALCEALVIGEDLGTVEEGLRYELMEAGVLSTRLVWFEDRSPEHLPTTALAMVTTHDLPTIAGVWTGADERELIALGRPTPEAEQGSLRRRLASVVGLPDETPPGPVIDAVHEQLGRSPAVLALATLEDLCEVPERPNVPGTTSERPNWSRALPLTTEALPTDDAVAGHLRHLAVGRGQ